MLPIEHQFWWHLSVYMPTRNKLNCIIISSSNVQTYQERLHDPAQHVLVRLKRQELIVPVASVVEHPTAGVQELPEVGSLRHLCAKSYLTTALAQLFPDHFQFLLLVMAQKKTC